MKSRIINWFNTFIHINRYKQELESRQQSLESRIRGLENSLKDEISDIRKYQFERDYINLLADEEKLRNLNLKLSITPIVWGDADRLEISEKAAVGSCIFNTNSGKIIIGDYTYAGSGVSILAGSHDPELEGFIRRDVEYKDGYDVCIGKGVWLGSNSTILGPCVIGDNAVIAAGAVIVPGTRVGKAELFAGVPAKKIKSIQIINDLERDPQKMDEIIDRESGVLFYSGWSEKKPIDIGGRIHVGHWTEKSEAIIYTNRKEFRLFITGEEPGENKEVTIKVNNDQKILLNIGCDPVNTDIITDKDRARLVLETEGKVFVSWEEMK